MMLPIGSQSDFSGVVNVLQKKAYIGPKSEPADCPAEMVDQVEELYTNIVEAAVEADEALMEKYFEDEALTDEEISNGLRAAIVNGDYIPVLVGAGGSDMIGLGAMLDLLVQISPSPADRPFTATGPAGEETLDVSDVSPLSMLVFKTTADPYVGKLTYFRVYGGIANSGATGLQQPCQEEERLGQISVMRG